MKLTTMILFLAITSISWSQWTYVPDNNFENYLEQIGAGNGIANDDYVSTSNISARTSLNISNKNISNLTGIEAFTSLAYLRASQNPFTTANLSSNVNLVNVEIVYGNLNNLNVTGCTQLTHLKIFNNPISSVNLTTCVALREFWARECYLTSIDFTQNPSLEIIEIRQNNISSLNVTQNPNLIRIAADQNNIGSIDLSNNLVIEQAHLNANNIQTVTLANNSLLNWLALNDNLISTLDVSTLPALKTLSFVQNNITQMDLTSNLNLINLYSGYNPLSSISLPATSTFTYFDSPATQFTTIDLTMCPGLRSIRMRDNQLTSIDLSTNGEVRTLELENNLLTELDVTNNPFLYVFACFGNDLTCLKANNGNNANVLRFWAYSNPNLTCIQVDDPNASYLSNSAWNIDPQSSYSSDCSLACNPCTLMVDAGADVTVYPGVSVINSPCGGALPNFGCTNLSATPSNGTAPFTFLWSTGETTQTITACPTTATNYTVSITDANGCTATDDVYVNTCNITTNGGNKVQVVNSQGNVISINMHALGAHLCNGGTLATGLCGGANRVGASKDNLTLEAFPNPSDSGDFTLRFSQNGNHTITVTDVQGRILLEQTIENDQTTIHLGEFGKQMYFLNYFDGEQNKVIKLIH